MKNSEQKLIELAQQLGRSLQTRRWLLATAESCTGGWIAAAITAIAGSSQWFERGFVTYSNEAKQEMLGVQAVTLATYGAVSEQVAREMAEGALRQSRAHISVAITGIAGPSGGSEDKPVGLVWFAWAIRGGTTEACAQHFQGDRTAIRYQAVVFALQGILARAQ